MKNAVILTFNESVPKDIVLRTDNGPHYISREFRKNFLNDPTFRNRFEKKDVEMTLDEI